MLHQAVQQQRQAACRGLSLRIRRVGYSVDTSDRSSQHLSTVYLCFAVVVTESHPAQRNSLTLNYRILGRTALIAASKSIKSLGL